MRRKSLACLSGTNHERNEHYEKGCIFTAIGAASI